MDPRIRIHTKMSWIRNTVHNTDKSAYPTLFTDQNLVDVSVKDLEVVNTVVANNDEILDVVHLGDNASHLAVACNSSALRLYEVWGFFFIFSFSNVADP